MKYGMNAKRPTLNNISYQRLELDYQRQVQNAVNTTCT